MHGKYYGAGYGPIVDQIGDAMSYYFAGVPL